MRLEIWLLWLLGLADLSKKKPQICCICGLFSSREIGAARGNRISATTPATAGWYRIAQSAGSISNCMGLFEITGAVSGAHSVSLIAAGLSYGKGLNLIQLAHAPWSGPALTKARIVYHPTYSGNFAYLEVYLSQAQATPISVNLLGGQGWTLVAPSTAGAVLSGYSVKELTLAEGKIVANVNGSLSGNAATATKLATARTIALSGEATASGTFDGSGNLTLAATLKNSGATAGSYGPGAEATLAFGGSVNVPRITVDAKGRITAIAHRTIKLPAAPASVTGNAGTATKLATARTIDGVSFNGSANITHFGVCSTAAATAAKTVAVTGFALVAGARVTVQFTVTNTASNPTLNVNGTGAKSIVYRNAAIGASYLVANGVLDFVYDGTNYEFIGYIDTNNRVGMTASSNDATYPILTTYTANRTASATEGSRFSPKVMVNPSTEKIVCNGLELRNDLARSWVLSLKPGGAAIQNAARSSEFTPFISHKSTNGAFGFAGYSTTMQFYYIDDDTIAANTNNRIEYWEFQENGTFLSSGGFRGNLTGRADTATKLATARTITLSGDVTASGTFDGSSNLALTAVLKNSGATAGAYGPTANATPAFNGTFSVPQITVDAKGRVTAAATRTVKIPANPVATQSANGLLSAADKKKLDGFASSGIMRINYKSYKDFTLNANFTMPYDGIATLFITGSGWGVISLLVDGIEVGRARLYGEDDANPCDSVTAIVRSGKVVKGVTKDGRALAGQVRCFKCE